MGFNSAFKGLKVNYSEHNCINKSGTWNVYSISRVDTVDTPCTTFDNRVVF